MPWIDLDDTKAHLNKSSSADDGELLGFIDAACAMVEDIKGHVEPVAVTETLRTRSMQRPRSSFHGWYQGWDHALLLTEVPVLSITSVLFVPGDGTSTAVVKQDIPGGVPWGWRLEGSAVFVPYAAEHRYGGFEVTYQAGLNPIPANYRLAALELVAHLWRTTQLNAAQNRPTPGEPDQEYARGATFAMPFRVRELLGIYGNTVGNAGVTIA